VNRAKSGRPALETQAILRHWLEAVPNDRLAHLVRDAARGLGRSLQARLAAHGVAFGHWIFLRILWERQGLTQRELSLEAGVMEPTTSAALEALEKAGYVRRRKKAGNRKNLHVFLTREGAALKTHLVPLAEAVNERALRGIKPAHVAITRRTLLALIRNLAEDTGDAVARRPDGIRGRKRAGGGASVKRHAERRARAGR
jgi:MarR family transcriptional regulator, organic hydroperoxide resistance regulator